MIKFEILSADNAEQIIARFSEKEDFSSEEMGDMIYSFLKLLEEGDIEVGVTTACGCLLARIFDMGRYMFVYPIELSEKSEPAAAVLEIREYAVREELPLVITDVPRESLGELASEFNHTVIDAERGGDSFRLEARSECALLDEPPTVTLGDITLSAPSEADISDMARLNRDAELNKYWGYDYLSDVGDIPDGYFLEIAEREFYMGTTLTLAVRALGEYVGEALLYGFDLSGGAEIGVRILPEHQGRGYGGGAIDALRTLAESIGLSRLVGRAYAENEPSVRMMGRRFEEIRRDGDRVYFELEL